MINLIEEIISFYALNNAEVFPNALLLTKEQYNILSNHTYNKEPLSNLRLIYVDYIENPRLIKL